jgi:hypothetical protein
VHRFAAKTDRIACEVYRQAAAAGQPVSIALVRRVMADLPEDDAVNVSQKEVFATAKIWERSVSATRRRARA